jgi:hypothetical protein
MLIRINATTLHLQNVIAGDRCVKNYISSKAGSFKWILVPVYGVAQEEI